MKCPMCGGDFDNVNLKTVGGSGTWAKHCNQCGGFWFEREPTEFLSLESIHKVDAPAPNYSLKQMDLVCSNDNSLLIGVEREDLPAGTQYWKCPDCEGTFYPKGQLALMVNHQHDVHGEHIAGLISARSRTTLAGVLVFIGIGAVIAVGQKTQIDLNAAPDQVLPTNGPNILTLLLLGITYLAGTILAVLGRKVPIVLVGWCVIIICLVGFAIIIFGP
ncbi:MAG: zf-TFIIB domain-containing protein [Patescibacteria group bacterium]